jgi:hypothetical protein
MWQTGVSVTAEVSSSATILSLPQTKAEQDFVLKISILRQYATTTMILGNMNQPADCHFIQLLCRDLEDFRSKHKQVWGAELEIILLGGQLCIYTQQLERSSRRDDLQAIKLSNSELETSRKILINTAFNVAARFVVEISRPPSTGSVSTSLSADLSSHRYLPKHYLQMLLVATFTILRVSVLYSDAVIEVRTVGLNQISQAYDILTTMSMREEDEPFRAARLIKRLSDAQRGGLLTMKEARVGLASGITVVRDAIATGKAILGEDEPDGAQRVGDQISQENSTPKAVTPQPVLSEHDAEITGLQDLAFSIPPGTNDDDVLFGWNSAWEWDAAWGQNVGIDWYGGSYV